MGQLVLLKISQVVTNQSGGQPIAFAPSNPKIVYASAWNNGIFRSAPSLEGGNAAYRQVYAIVGLQQFQDLAMFDLTVADKRTRIYVYNGTASTATQRLYRLDNADVPASKLVTGSGANVANTSAWINLTSTDTSHAGSLSRSLCSSQCFYDLVVAVPHGKPDTVLIAGVATPTFGESTLRSVATPSLYW